MRIDLSFLAVLGAIICSGSLIPFTILSYSAILLCELAFLTAIFFIIRPKIDLNILAFYMAFVVLSSCSMLYNESLGKSDIGSLIRLTIAFLMVLIIDFDNFARAYTRIISWLALASIVFYAVGVLFSVNKFLPIIYNDAGTVYSHAGIYFYQGGADWNYRNAGIFWEAGAFVSFLALALILNDPKCKEYRRRQFTIVLALLLTLSSVAFIILSLSALYYLSRSAIMNKRRIESYLAIFVAIGMVGWVVVPNLIDHFATKLVITNISALDRYVGMLADISIISSSPIFGVGYDGYFNQFEPIALSFGAVAPTSTNSYLGIAAVKGIPFAIIFTALYLLLFKFKCKSSLPLMIAFLIPVFQGLFNFPIFYAWVLYAVKKRKSF